MRLLFFILGLFVFVGAARAEDSLNLAVINTPETANLGALVEAELSTDSQFRLLERSDLSKIGDEAKLQQLGGSDPVALGKLMGAAGLLFIGNGPNGPTVRFAAVKLGYVLFDDPLTSAKDLPGQAKAIAHLVENYAPKLRLQPQQAVFISVLNLRADSPTFESATTERNLTLLLESKLMSLPNYVVLERRHAWSIGFERPLSPEAMPLLRGAYLVDGSLLFPTQGASDLTVRLRLRTPTNQQTELEAHGPEADLKGLAEQIAGEIQKAVSPSSFVNLPWEPQKEAREYLTEGIWAWRNNQPEAALEALDSAELLGETAPDLLAARVPVLCEMAADTSTIDTAFPEIYRRFQDTIPADLNFDDRIEKALRAMDDATRYKNSHGELNLQILQYHPPDPEVIDKSDGRPKDLTTLASRSATRVLWILDQLHDVRADQLRQSLRLFAGYSPLQHQMSDDWFAATLYADEWSVSPEEIIAYFEALASTMPSSNRGENDHLYDDVHWILLRKGPEIFGPRFSKNREEQHSLFDRMVNQIIADPAARPMGLLTRATWDAPTEKRADYHAFMEELWTRREELMQKGQLAVWLSEANSPACQLSDPFDPEFVSLLHYFLQNESHWQPGPYCQVWTPKYFPPGEAPALWKDFEESKNRSLAYFARHVEPNGAIVMVDTSEMQKTFAELEDDYAKQFGNSGIPQTSAPTAAGSLEVTRFWHPPRESAIILRNLFGARGASGTLWVYGWDAGYFQDHGSEVEVTSPAALFKVTLPDLKTETSTVPWPAYPNHEENFVEMQVGSDRLYISSRSNVPGTSNLDRFLFSSHSWARHEISPSIRDLFLAGKKIYFSFFENYPDGSQETGLQRHDWETNQTTLLASSRRRPAQNQFDDRPAFTVSGVSTGLDGKDYADIDTLNYVIQDRPGNWPAKTVTQAEMFPGIPKDPTIGGFPALFPGMATEPSFYPPSKEAAWFRAAEQKVRLDGEIIGYGHRGSDIFMLVQSPFKLWWLQPGDANPIPIPLHLAINDDTKITLSKIYSPSDTEMLSAHVESKQVSLTMTITDQGLCLFFGYGGFWFLPFSDIDAYLASHPNLNPLSKGHQ